MEVDSIVTSKLQPIEPKLTSNTRILFGVAHGSDETKGATPIPTSAHVEITTFFNGVVD